MDAALNADNELEHALHLAAKDKTHYPLLLETLIPSSVILLAHPSRGRNEGCVVPFIHWPSPFNQTLTVIPCFSSPLVAQASVNFVSTTVASQNDFSDHYVEQAFSELVTTGYPNVVFHINPVSPFGAELYPDDIERLLGK